MARAGGIRTEGMSQALAVNHLEGAGDTITHFELRVIARDPGVLDVAHEVHAVERELLAWLRSGFRDVGGPAMGDAHIALNGGERHLPAKPRRAEPAPAKDDL